MELLTGDCKKKFEEWYLKGQHNDSGYHNYLLRSLYSKGLAMQYGVLVDFFDSVGVYIEVKIKPNENYNYGIHNKIEWIISSEFFKTRPQARKQAIQKANELFNNK